SRTAGVGAPRTPAAGLSLVRVTRAVPCPYDGTAAPVVTRVDGGARDRAGVAVDVSFQEPTCHIPGGCLVLGDTTTGGQQEGEHDEPCTVDRDLPARRGLSRGRCGHARDVEGAVPVTRGGRALRGSLQCRFHQDDRGTETAGRGRTAPPASARHGTDGRAARRSRPRAAHDR